MFVSHDMDKQLKLSNAVAELERLTKFLKPYLPLANVHNTNFIVSQHWDRMIPEGIGLELLQLNDHRLTLLPSGDLYCLESSHSSRSYVTKDGGSFMNSVEANTAYRLKPDLTCSLHHKSNAEDDIIVHREEIAMTNYCDIHDLACEKYGQTGSGIFMNSEAANAASCLRLDSNQSVSCDLNCEYMSDNIMHREEIATMNCELIDIVDENCEQSDKVANVHNSLTVSHPVESDRLPEWDHSLVPDWQHQSLKEFIMAAISCTLPQLGVLTSLAKLSDRLAISLSDSQSHIVVSHSMKVKKSYEVDVMASVCAWIARGLNISNVVDVGSGRGYLGCHLSLMYHIPVIGIDSSPSNTSSAAKRTRLLRKHWHGLTKRYLQNEAVSENMECFKNEETKVNDGANFDHQCLPTDAISCSDNLEGPGASNSDGLENSACVSSSESCSISSSNLFTPMTMFVNSQITLDDLISEHYDNSSLHHIMLTGLHTCGNLSADILRLFIATRSAEVVCQVGCCYNLLGEKFLHFSGVPAHGPSEAGFPLCSFLTERGCQIGRNARMLACHSLPRTASYKNLPNKLVYWRALLQQVLSDNLGFVCDEWRVGKISPKGLNFVSYARKALSKLGYASKLQITDETLAGYTERYAEMERKHMAFFQLKMVLGPCVETLILLDRLAYLLEQEDVADAFIIPLFDAVVSPRCYAIVAVKTSANTA